LGTAFYDAIYYSVANKLAPVQTGRKALLLLSDGEDNSSAHHMMEAVETCQRADVSVFAVRYTEGRRGQLTARNKYGIGVIGRLARETGGVDFDAEKDDLRTSFKRIGEDLRASYELAYASTNTGRDGAFRNIRVKVNRPGFSVRCKTGYYGN
jgi:Ca-activated chloride channel family protein